MPRSSSLEGLIFTVASFIMVFSSIEYLDKKDFFTKIAKNVHLKRELKCMNNKEKKYVNSIIVSMLKENRMTTYSILDFTSTAIEVRPFFPPINEKDNLFSIKILRGPYIKNEFTERFSEFEIIGEDHVIASDFMDLKESEGIELENNTAIWITNIRQDGASLTLWYELTKYYKKYSLNKQMYCKFPKEKNYPIKVLLEAIPDLKKGNYEIIKKLPL